MTLNRSMRLMDMYSIIPEKRTAFTAPSVLTRNMISLACRKGLWRCLLAMSEKELLSVWESKAHLDLREKSQGETKRNGETRFDAGR